MKNPRGEKLVEKLKRGISKSLEVFRSVEPDLWEQPIFDDPESWDLKDLVAHIINSQQLVLSLAHDLASGGEGSPEDIDIDAFNENGIETLRHRSVDDLLDILTEIRKASIAWVLELDELELDRVGRHPVLGASNVETIINSIYAHQLLHMRELATRLRK